MGGRKGGAGRGALAVYSLVGRSIGLLETDATAGNVVCVGVACFMWVWLVSLSQSNWSVITCLTVLYWWQLLSLLWVTWF